MNGARWLFLLLWSAAASGAGAGDARLFFSRTFPGSAPPYMEVRVAATGDAEYRKAPDEEMPLPSSSATASDVKPAVLSARRNAR